MKRELTLIERRLLGEGPNNHQMANPDQKALMARVISGLGANFLGEWEGTRDEAVAWLEKYFPRSLPSALQNMEQLSGYFQGVTWHSANIELCYVKTAAGVGSHRVFIGTAKNGDTIESIHYQGWDPQGSQRYYRVNRKRQILMSTLY